MCFVPVTMTSLLTRAKGMDRLKSVLASADATFTLSEGADVVLVLRWVAGHAAVVDVGGWILMTRSLCTFLMILCSNELVYTGFGGEVGQLVTEQCINGNKKGWQSDGNGCKDTVGI